MISNITMTSLSTTMMPLTTIKIRTFKNIFQKDRFIRLQRLLWNDVLVNNYDDDVIVTYIRESHAHPIIWRLNIMIKSSSNITMTSLSTYMLMSVWNIVQSCTFLYNDDSSSIIMTTSLPIIINVVMVTYFAERPVYPPAGHPAQLPQDWPLHVQKQLSSQLTGEFLKTKTCTKK